MPIELHRPSIQGQQQLHGQSIGTTHSMHKPLACSSTTARAVLLGLPPVDPITFLALWHCRVGRGGQGMGGQGWEGGW